MLLASANAVTEIGSQFDLCGDEVEFSDEFEGELCPHKAAGADLLVGSEVADQLLACFTYGRHC